MELTTVGRFTLTPTLISAEDAIAAASEFLSEYVGVQLTTGTPVQMSSAVHSTWIVPIQAIDAQKEFIENIGVVAVDKETGRVTGWTPIEQIKEASHWSITRTDTKERSNSENGSENLLPVDINRSRMDKNVVAYKAMHAQLVQRYLGRFVAIYEGQLVDHDPDPVVLLARIRAHYPNQVILRRKVETTAERELHIRHPRIETAQ